MIATRREFMKFSAATAAGLVLRPVADPLRSARDLCESQACPIEKDGRYWRQRLLPGESILGPIYVDEWRFESMEKLDRDVAVEMKLSVANDVLFKNVVNQMGVMRWAAMPGTSLFVAHGTEVVFGCSSKNGLCTVSFEKLL